MTARPLDAVTQPGEPTLKFCGGAKEGAARAYLSAITVGCSSVNSSGAGTNMLTTLGADSRLDLVAPGQAAERQLVSRDLLLGTRDSPALP